MIVIVIELKRKPNYRRELITVESFDFGVQQKAYTIALNTERQYFEGPKTRRPELISCIRIRETWIISFGFFSIILDL